MKAETTTRQLVLGAAGHIDHGKTALVKALTDIDTDRMVRFSKIGGEMVPHGKVENSLQEAAEEPMQVFAVTCIPDEKKGERLAVLHTLSEEDIPAIVDKLSDMGLSNLFIPRANQFVKVAELPMLGTGKLDLRGVKKTAMEASGVEPEKEAK